MCTIRARSNVRTQNSGKIEAMSRLFGHFINTNSMVSPWKRYVTFERPLVLFTNNLLLYSYEPFGLGRFATDHSLTKVASRPLFVRVRHYTTQLTSASRPYPPQKITNS